MARQEIPLTVLGPGGGALSGVSVTVNKRGAGAATIFAAETGTTTAANPLTTDAAGAVTAWAERGRYDLVVSDPSGRIGSYTFPWDSSPPELYGALQSGVIAAGDLAVTGSANMVLPVAAGVAIIVNASGLLLQYGYVGGTVTVGANASGNPRIDQVVFDGSTVSVLAGTATVGATLDNRTGAAALPTGSIRLADVLVANGATALASAVIRDRRPWARGAYVSITRSGLGADYTTASGVVTLVDSTNLQPRIECTGVPLRVITRVIASNSAVNTSASHFLGMNQDGVRLSDADSYVSAATTDYVGFVSETVFTPAAGSHLFGLTFATNGAQTLTLRVNTSSGQRLVFQIEELVHQNSPNNATTG